MVRAGRRQQGRQEENKIKDVIDSDQHSPLDEPPSPGSDLSSSDFPDFSDDSYNTFSDEESTRGHYFLPNSVSSDVSFKGPLEIACDSGAMIVVVQSGTSNSRSSDLSFNVPLEKIWQ